MDNTKRMEAMVDAKVDSFDATLAMEELVRMKYNSFIGSHFKASSFDSCFVCHEFLLKMAPSRQYSRRTRTNGSREETDLE